MLNYLILVTENTAVAAILTGLMFAYISKSCGKRARIILSCGFLLGIIGAAAVAVLKNTTKIIDSSGGTGALNVRIFTASLILFVIYCVMNIKAVRKLFGGKEDIVVSSTAALLLFTLVFYALPDVLAYPFTFSLNGESVFSAAFFSRFTGYILAVIIAVLICLAVYRTAKRMSAGTIGILLIAELFVNGIQQSAKIIQVLHAKRVISGHAAFVFARFTSNNSNLFIYAALALAFIMPLVLWIKSFHVNEPYENPAQHRKIRAKWRNIRRWATLLCVCFVMVVINMTVFAELNSREVELAPAEQCEERGGNLYIPFSQVEDGHLHRFAYKTKDNIDTRFIIIKKPNSSSYGVGLDACDICGETGYYERNGQIVCKLCDVVMNINTIGFKGGCNPIVIDYSVENGYIIVPTSTLVEHQNEFK